MPVSVPAFILGIGFVVGCATAVLKRRENAIRKRLPPGPPGLPLIGNLRDLPRPGDFEAHHWQKLKEKYGPLSALNVMGQTIIIINDANTALQLLERRTMKYSGRPKQTFAGLLIGWDNLVGYLQNDSRFRAMRRAMSRVIGSNNSAAAFNYQQEAKNAHFLLHVLETPGDLVEHVKRSAGSLILEILYGYNAEIRGKDPLVSMAGEAMENFGVAAVPGKFLVDFVPSLRFLPDWFPGAGFKRTAKEWRSQLMTTADVPYEFVKHQQAQGQKNISYLSQLFDAGEPNDEVKHVNKWSTFSLYAGGADTSVYSITNFFLAMTICPTAQRKAQQEIDRVVGSKRLPSFADRPNLPYVDAILKEVLRWAPVAPMCLPHMVSEDDEYEGYLIPKGAMILPNIWHFMHDEEIYHDPMTFNPDRFIKTDKHIPEPDPYAYVFGFGRRVCPGRILADNAVFINIAQCLAVFDISKVVRNGREVDPVIDFEPGVISRPAPFENSITPRSPEHERLIRSVGDQYPWQPSDSKVLQDIARSHQG